MSAQFPGRLSSLRAGYEVVELKPWLYTIAVPAVCRCDAPAAEEVELGDGKCSGHRGLAAEARTPTCACSSAMSGSPHPISGRRSSSWRSATTPTRRSRPCSASVARRSRRSCSRAREAAHGDGGPRARAAVRELRPRSSSRRPRGRARRRDDPPVGMFELCTGCADYEAAVPSAPRSRSGARSPPTQGRRVGSVGRLGSARRAGAGGATSAAGGLASARAGVLAAKVLLVGALVGASASPRPAPRPAARPAHARRPCDVAHAADNRDRRGAPPPCCAGARRRPRGARPRGPSARLAARSYHRERGRQAGRRQGRGPGSAEGAGHARPGQAARHDAHGSPGSARDVRWRQRHAQAGEGVAACAGQGTEARQGTEAGQGTTRRGCSRRGSPGLRTRPPRSRRGRPRSGPRLRDMAQLRPGRPRSRAAAWDPNLRPSALVAPDALTRHLLDRLLAAPHALPRTAAR